MWRLAQQKKGNRRRLWRLALATHPRTQANEVIVDWALCYGSHAATKGSRLSMSCGFRGAGPISWNPLQAAKQRSCGYVRHLHLNIVPRRGTDASTMMLRMIVGPALRNQERVRGCLSHSCAPSELAVGFWKIRVPSGHGADWLFCYGRLRGYGETP